MHTLQKIIFFLFPLAALAQNNLAVHSVNKIQFADQFAGADACYKIQNAIAALPINGGEVDSRSLLGFQTCAVNPFANLVGHTGASVHLYLAAGSIFTTSVQWDIPTASIVTGGGRSASGGGMGTLLIANAKSFPKNTAVIYLGDTGHNNFGVGQGARAENLSIDCNHVSGCMGVFSDRVQEQGGIRNLSIANYPAVGAEMLDQVFLPPGGGGQPENYMLDELELSGDPGSTCLRVRVGSGGQRGGGRITCTASLVEQANLSCSAGVVTATLPRNTIPTESPIGVESGTDFSFGGVFTVTKSSPTQLQWLQPGCTGTSQGAVIGAMTRSGVQLDGSDGIYYQIHCEFTVDCVLIDSSPLPDGWTTRALTVSGVTGQSSVKNIVHLATATHPEDIVLTALQRCIGPRPNTEGCAANILQDDLSKVTLRDTSLAWYLLGHSSSGASPAILSSSPSLPWVLPNPSLTFPNTSNFSQLGKKQNGTLTFCSDCTVATPSSCSPANPSACVCRGGGKGAFAKRIDSVWLCN
jgi:hypothetical protein